MFRNLACQRRAVTDNFSLIRLMKSFTAKEFDKQPVISEFLTKKDEGQIAVSINAPDLHSLFRNKFTYGHDDKYDLLKRLRKSKATVRKSCLVANYIIKTSLKQSIADIETCGYLIRLQYWPETHCETQHDNLREINVNSISKDILKRPEFTSKVREKLRKQAIRRIEQGNWSLVGS